VRLTLAPLLLLTLRLALPAGVGAQEALHRDAFFDSDGTRIRYVVRGTGPPVVLVHGFAVNLELNWAWTGVLDSLAARYMVVAPDLRGHGASDKPHDPDAYGTRFVEDLVRLLDHLGLPRAHFVGYSMGGAITLKLLTAHPDRVASAVLGGFGWRPAEFGLPERVREWLPQLERAARGDTTVAEVLVGPEVSLLSPPVRAVLDGNDVAALLAVQGNRGLLAVTEADLRVNTIPVLAVVGEADWALSDVERMAGVMAHLEVVTVPGTTHLTTVGHPLFFRTVLRFLGGKP
jgi:pimeloyl-ACP methyl ester carboxylesterase